MADDPNVRFTADTDDEVSPRSDYHLIFVSDLQAGEHIEQLTPVDKESFSDLMTRARPTLALALKPPLGSGPDWEFELVFDSLKSFEPAGFLAQMTAAGPRLAIWEQIGQRRLGQVSEEQLATTIQNAALADPSLAWLQAAPGQNDSSAAPPPVDSGGSILDLVDEPDEKSRITAEVERVAADTGSREKRIGAAEGGQLDQRAQRLQLELTAIADAVLKHPDVRRLETAWRGLKFLVDHLDFRAGVRLAVLHASRDEAISHFAENVVDPVFDGELDTPGLVLFDYPCENTPVDVAWLDELGQHAAGLPVPAVFPLEASFFGVRTVKLIKNLPNLSGLVDGWEYAKWRSLREQPYSRWLVPVLGRFVLRAPFEARSRAREFTCAEKITKASDVLWAGGHLAMGVCAARAHARHGWPTRMFGVEAGKIEDLPVVTNPTDVDNPWGPGDAVLPESKVGEFAPVGINLLQGIRGKDYCVLSGGVTAARPKPTADIGAHQAALEVSLPYQQFSNIAGAWLCEQLPALRGLDEEVLQKKLLIGLRDLLQLGAEDPKETVGVGIGPAPDNPTQKLVHVEITPPDRVVPGGLNIHFNFPLPS
ncbi:MAG: type VI secretion system contractile sheath large subunit [Planctomycetota bacterium]